MKKRGKLLPVRIIGDKILRQVAKPVTEITDEIKQLIADLKITLYEKDGVGLAAPQVGISLRIVISDPYWYRDNRKNPRVLINPKFLEFEGETTSEEGCLSIPGIFEKVIRADRVVIEALDENGELRQYSADGLFATSLQHEYDHLEGILFVDRVPKLKRVFLKRKIRELESTTDEDGINLRNEKPD